MIKSRINPRKNFKIIKRIVFFAFFFLFLVLSISLFVNFNFYVTANGNIENDIQIPLINKIDGIVVNVKVKNGQKVVNDQVIGEIKGADGKIYSITSPKSGEFLDIGDADLTVGGTVSSNQICGIILRKGLFFKAFVSEQDIFNIKEGLNCFIRIWSFDKANYAPMDGNVFCVSESPSFQEYKTFYPVYCVIKEPYFLKNKTKLGLSGNVKILIGKNTIFNIILGRRQSDDN